MPHGPEVIILVLKDSYDPPGSMGPRELHTPLMGLGAGTLDGLTSPWGPTIKCHGRMFNLASQ